MKKVIDLSIGGLKFSLEDDAHLRLEKYLKAFEKTIEKPEDRKEVMDDVKSRIAEILQKEQTFANQVIDMAMINSVINHLGEVDETESTSANTGNTTYTTNSDGYTEGPKKIFRDVDNRMAGGISAGFGAYLGVDPTIIRIVFVLLVLLFGTGILAYIVLWIVIPKAETLAQKLQLRGYAVTDEIAESLNQKTDICDYETNKCRQHKSSNEKRSFGVLHLIYSIQKRCLHIITYRCFERVGDDCSRRNAVSFAHQTKKSRTT